MTGLELFFIAASTAVSVASTVMQSQAEEEAQMANARIATQRAEDQRIRAEEGRQNAIQEQAAAQRKAIARRREAERLVSEQRAKFGNAGVGGLWGTAGEVMAETVDQGEYNAEMELWQGDERARAIRADAESAERQGAILDSESSNYKRAAKNVSRGLGLAVAGDILGGATKAVGSMKTSSSTQYRWG